MHDWNSNFVNVLNNNLMLTEISNANRKGEQNSLK